MSGRVTASPERVFVAPSQNTANSQSKPQSRKEFEAGARQGLALRVESNRLKASISEDEKSISKNKASIDAGKVRVNQASEKLNNLSQEKGELSERERKIKEAQLRALQRKNS